MKTLYPVLLILLVGGCGGSKEPFAAQVPGATAKLATSLQEAPQVVARRLVKTVGLDLRVRDTATVSSDVQKLTTEFGGHIGNMTAERHDSGVVYQ